MVGLPSNEPSRSRSQLLGNVVIDFETILVVDRTHVPIYNTRSSITNVFSMRDIDISTVCWTKRRATGTFSAEIVRRFAAIAAIQ